MTRRIRFSLLTKPGRTRRNVGIITAGILVMAVCGTVRHFWGPDEANAAKPVAEEAPQRAAAPEANPKFPNIVALVNAQQITLNQLGQHAIRYHGEAVLEAMINKRLIAGKCEQLNVTITEKDIDDEIHRIAERFRLTEDRWLKLLQEERNVKPAQYRSDVVWPMLSLRRLAAHQLSVTDQQVREAYETEYGPAVKVRLIAVGDRQKLERIRAQAVAKPDDFGRLAKEYSEDTYSASVMGLIQPIRLHTGDKAIEKAAFSLRPGEISPVVQIANQFVILKCEGGIPDRYRQFPLADEKVRTGVIEQLRDQKLRGVADSIFKKLQEEAQIKVVYADAKERERYPGIAALVNNDRITLRELSEACVERHGTEILQLLINRTLIEQACQRRKVAVNEDELDEEVARVAVAMGKVNPKTGQADVAALLETIKQEQNMNQSLYRQDIVWPSVAMRKLVGDKIQVTAEDLKKGYEANYGERVRCRAIVLGTQRRAQEVWDLARRNPSVEYFSNLAEQYSVEGSSRALRGEIPPIQRHGGKPNLEQEAFALKPGELSGIVQLGDKFVILLCEGRTKPVTVDFDRVRDLLTEEIRDKKLRAGMAETFAKLNDSSRIENFLTGQRQEPAEQTNPVSSTDGRSGAGNSNGGNAGFVNPNVGGANPGGNVGGTGAGGATPAGYAAPRGSQPTAGQSTGSPSIRSIPQESDEAPIQPLPRSANPARRPIKTIQ